MYVFKQESHLHDPPELTDQQRMEARQRARFSTERRTDARGRGGVAPIDTSTEENSKRVAARNAANNARNHALPEQTEKPWGAEEPTDSEAERKKMDARKRDAWKKTPARMDRAKGRGAAR